MKRFAALVFCLFVGATQAGALTYFVDFGMTLNPVAEQRGSVTGHINTDGTLGTITAANLIDWSITLDDGTTQITGTGEAGDGTNAGLFLTATAQYLLAPATNFFNEFWSFEFSNGSFGINGTRFARAFDYDGGQLTSFVWLEEFVWGSYTQCFNFYNTIGVHYIQGESQCGPVQIPEWFIVGRAVVPLPASLPILATAVACLAFGGRRRRALQDQYRA